MQNQMNKIMNQKEFTQFGDSKKWDLSEFEAYNKGFNDEGWEKFNNPTKKILSLGGFITLAVTIATPITKNLILPQ